MLHADEVKDNEACLALDMAEDMDIEDKAYNTLVTRCNDIVKKSGHSILDFYLLNKRLVLRCVPDSAGNQAFISVMFKHVDGCYYFMHEKRRRKHRSISHRVVLEMCMKKLENENVLTLNLDMPYSSLEDAHFMDKNDTLESLAIEHDMKV